MAEPYVGEIRMFGGNFAPVGWAFCNGQLLSIADNTTLFTLIGTIYGGDGQNTFGLPNLISRMGMGASSTHPLGELAGVEEVTLVSNQLPSHTHPVRASDNAATSTSPTGNVWASWGEAQYTTGPAGVAMDPTGVAPSGQGLPHDNRAPYLGISFIIALEGIFPSRN